MFLQRHLCHTIQQNFNFLDKHWGVHDQALEFARKADQSFALLRLYPFVQRFNCTDVTSYHKSVDAAFPVTVATPHLVSPEIWNYLCYTVPFAPLYKPNPNPHINEWHKHNPPPGTAYHPLPRMNHPSLVNRPDTVTVLEQLHARAPYDNDISFNLVRIKYHDQATFEQEEEIYRPVLDFASGQMYELSRKLTENPDQYEKLLSKAAAINPYRYYNLGEFFAGLDREGKAVFYLQKAMELCPDAVAAARQAGWLIKYYQRNGQIEKAQQLADMAGEVYSADGLTAKAEFLEFREKYGEAFEWYVKIEDRYEDSSPLLSFCTRYKNKTGDSRFDKEAQGRLKKIFPHGVEKINKHDLKGPPTDGLLLREGNDLTSHWGLKTGDVLVALYGVRIHNLEQYTCARDTTADSKLALIIWRDRQYIDLQASPPGRSFGADFAHYTGQSLH